MHTPFTRFFEAAHEGFYIGTLDGGGSTTQAANAHLKLVLGYPYETPEWLVLPFDPERFVDADARDAFLARLQKDGAVSDHLLRLRRMDQSTAWVEITASAELNARCFLLFLWQSSQVAHLVLIAASSERVRSCGIR